MPEPGTGPLAALLHAAARDAPDLVALREGTRELTFAALSAAVEATAASWPDPGPGGGRRIGVWAVNTLDCAVLMLAVVAAGGVLVPLNPRYTAGEVAAILARVDPRFLVAPGVHRGRDLGAEAARLVSPDRLVRLDGGSTVTLAAGRTPGPRERHDARGGDGGGEQAIVQFTSGSTGEPKGVILREAPLVASAAVWAATAGLRRGDVFPVTYPLAHVGGFKTGLLSPLQARATAVLLPHVSRASVAAAVGGGRDGAGAATVLSAPPTVQDDLLAAVRAGELTGPPRVRTAVIGSAVVPPDLVTALYEEVGVRDVVIGYGLTEATGVCTMTRPGDPPELVRTSVGRPIEGVEVRVAAGHGGHGGHGPDHVGELEVRGASVMAGYLDDPAATAEVVRDGWLRTGDLAWRGDDGYVRIVGRARELVLVGGFNVVPGEVEHALRAHPAVAEAAVVGVAHPRLGEVPAAFVVAHGGPDEPDEPDLLAWLRGRLADFKVPRHLWFVDALPRAATGKVDRRALADGADRRVRRLT